MELNHIPVIHVIDNRSDHSLLTVMKLLSPLSVTTGKSSCRATRAPVPTCQMLSPRARHGNFELGFSPPQSGARRRRAWGWRRVRRDFSSETLKRGNIHGNGRVGERSGEQRRAGTRRRSLSTARHPPRRKRDLNRCWGRTLNGLGKTQRARHEEARGDKMCARAMATLRFSLRRERFRQVGEKKSRFKDLARDALCHITMVEGDVKFSFEHDPMCDVGESLT